MITYGPGQAAEAGPNTITEPAAPEYKITWNVERSYAEGFQDGFSDGYSRGWQEAWDTLTKPKAEEEIK